MFGHGSVGVDFDHEVEVAGLTLVADGSIWAHDGLVGIGGFELGQESRCSTLSVSLPQSQTAALTGNLQATNILLARQIKPKLLGVMIDWEHLSQLQIHKPLVSASKGLGRAHVGRVFGLVDHVLSFSRAGSYTG